jgi:hypothetical protein
MIGRLRFRPLPALLMIVTLVSLALGGCGDDGDDDENPVKPEDPATYPALSTPQNVLLAYELAYSRRDTVMVGDLYDPTYAGSSVDLVDPGSSLQFSYEDEIAHVRALANVSGLVAYLDLGTSQLWERMPSDDPSHPEWAVIQVPGSNFLVEITHDAEVFGAGGELGTYQDFAFAPRLDSASPTDTLWRIVRWRETGMSSPGGP